MHPTGSITVRVWDEESGGHVQDALVSITRDVDGTLDFVACRFSDESGIAGPFSVDTVPASNSITPTQRPPSTLYDVWVEHPEYQLYLIRGVAVFPDVETVQSVPLSPLEGAFHQSDTVHTIPAEPL